MDANIVYKYTNIKSLVIFKRYFKLSLKSTEAVHII